MVWYFHKRRKSVSKYLSLLHGLAQKQTRRYIFKIWEFFPEDKMNKKFVLLVILVLCIVIIVINCITTLISIYLVSCFLPPARFHMRPACWRPSARCSSVTPWHAPWPLTPCTCACSCLHPLDIWLSFNLNLNPLRF